MYFAVEAADEMSDLTNEETLVGYAVAAVSMVETDGLPLLELPFELPVPDVALLLPALPVEPDGLPLG